MLTPTTLELLEILDQLGVVGHTADEPLEDLYQACLDAGLTPDDIDTEVEEQRGR